MHLGHSSLKHKAGATLNWVKASLYIRGLHDFLFCFSLNFYFYLFKWTFWFADFKADARVSKFARLEFQEVEIKRNNNTATKLMEQMYQGILSQYKTSVHSTTIVLSHM